MAKDFGKIQLGEGVLTYNNGSTDVELGLTRGGVFNDNIVFRHIEADGKKGQVKGDAVLETCLPTLEFTMIQMESALLDVVFANTVVTDATSIMTVKRSLGQIASTEYLANVMYVGKTTEGKAITIKLLNALGEGPMTFDYTDKGEVNIPGLFTGNMETIDDTEAPFEVILDETA